MRQNWWFLLLGMIWVGGCQTGQPRLTPTTIHTADLRADTQTTDPVQNQQPTPSHSPFPPITQTREPSQTPTSSLQPSVTPFPMVSLPLLIPGEEITIVDIKMISPSTGWAFGHQKDGFDRILYSQDGGDTWQDRTPPIEVTKISYHDIKFAGFFLDEARAWVIIPDKKSDPSKNTHHVWITEDSGINWTHSDPLPVRGVELDFIPREFFFINSQQGWLRVHLGYMMMHDYTNLYATEDGGKTWERLIDPESNQLQGYHNTGMAFASDRYGWVTKDSLGASEPLLEQTQDGGRSWEMISLPAPPGASWIEPPQGCRSESPTFTSPQTGLLLVNCFPYLQEGFNKQNPTSYLYATSDWGQNWHIHQFPTPVYQLTFIDYQTGFAMGTHLYQTNNGGINWSEIKTVTWQGDFNFISPQEGWAVARKGEDLALVHTVDGGRFWAQINPLATFGSQN